MSVILNRCPTHLVSGMQCGAYQTGKTIRRLKNMLLSKPSMNKIVQEQRISPEPLRFEWICSP